MSDARVRDRRLPAGPPGPAPEPGGDPWAAPAGGVGRSPSKGRAGGQGRAEPLGARRQSRSGRRCLRGLGQPKPSGRFCNPTLRDVVTALRA